MFDPDTPICRGKYSVDRAATFISNINRSDVDRYLDYWMQLKPVTPEEHYQRWIFAFMSIHTTWKANVAGFKAVVALGRDFKWPALNAAVMSAGVGLNKMRTHAIWDFHKRYWDNPSWFLPTPDETMIECRDRLVKSTYGIGETKTSFVLEMAFPERCGVVCLDTHILQLYDYYKKGTPTRRVYGAMEKHWVDTCETHDIPSPIARHIYWDRIQNQTSTRYWSYVLEKHDKTYTC